MAIGSLDKAGRLDQLRTLARVQVWSGYLTDDQVRTDVLAAVSDEESDPATAERLAAEFVEQAHAELAEAARHWPAQTAYDRLQSAFADLRARDVVVLEACDDHWAANEVLTAAAEHGAPPAGIAYFTHADVWHAVEHGMLELNVWHGSSANVAPGDDSSPWCRRPLPHTASRRCSTRAGSRSRWRGNAVRTRMVTYRHRNDRFSYTFI